METDTSFSGVVNRVGASGQPTPLLRGTGIRVQTIAIASQTWGLSVAQIAADWELSDRQVTEALAFYAAHRAEIDANIQAEERMAPTGA